MKLDHLWQQVHEMSESDLEAFARKHRIDMTQEFNDREHAADHICAQIGLDRPEDADDAGTKLDALARAEHAAHPELSYETCLGRMRKAHPELAARYAAHGFGVNRATGRTVSS